jgi:hypothetical protein
LESGRDWELELLLRVLRLLGSDLVAASSAQRSPSCRPPSGPHLRTSNARSRNWRCKERRPLTIVFLLTSVGFSRERSKEQQFSEADQQLHAISGRSRVQDAMAESETRYRSLFEKHVGRIRILRDAFSVCLRETAFCAIDPQDPQACIWAHPERTKTLFSRVSTPVIIQRENRQEVRCFSLN